MTATTLTAKEQEQLDRLLAKCGRKLTEDPAVKIQRCKDMKAKWEEMAKAEG
jgi:hypothetical protein